MYSAAKHAVASVMMITNLLLMMTGVHRSQTCLQYFDAVGWGAGKASGL